jgi:hypothetical protein
MTVDGSVIETHSGSESIRNESTAMPKDWFVR